jgi:hypothetical protein
LVNQTRAYYGVGYSETSTGGMAVKIHAAVRAELRTLKESGTCRTVRIRIAKTHFGEKRMFDFTLSDGVGIWEHTDLAERGIDAGLLVRGESGFSFRGRDVAKSYRDLLECLQSDCALAAEVKLAVQADLGMPQRKPASSAQHVVQPKVVGL